MSLFLRKWFFFIKKGWTKNAFFVQFFNEKNSFDLPNLSSNRSVTSDKRRAVVLRRVAWTARSVGTRRISQSGCTPATIRVEIRWLFKFPNFPDPQSGHWQVRRFGRGRGHRKQTRWPLPLSRTGRQSSKNSSRTFWIFFPGHQIGIF